MAEIASRDFMDNLTSLLKAYGPAAVNDEVKNKILDLIQNWAGAAENRPQLGYLQEVYRTLQHEGFRFPPKQNVAASMFDSNAVSVTCSNPWPRLTTVASRMDRLGRLHALPDRFHIHESKTSLQKLWWSLLWRLFEPDPSLTASRHTSTRQSGRWLSSKVVGQVERTGQCAKRV